MCTLRNTRTTVCLYLHVQFGIAEDSVSRNILVGGVCYLCLVFVFLPRSWVKDTILLDSAFCVCTLKHTHHGVFTWNLPLRKILFHVTFSWGEFVSFAWFRYFFLALGRKIRYCWILHFFCVCTLRNTRITVCLRGIWHYGRFHLSSNFRWGGSLSLFDFVIFSSLLGERAITYGKKNRDRCGSTLRSLYSQHSLIDTVC